MMKNLEYNAVKLFYWGFILFSAVIIAEIMVREINAPEFGVLDGGVELSLLTNLVIFLYMPVIGLLLLHYKKDIGYVILGMLLMYALFQFQYFLSPAVFVGEGWQILDYLRD